jgi:hypothetical protein
MIRVSARKVVVCTSVLGTVLGVRLIYGGPRGQFHYRS